MYLTVYTGVNHKMVLAVAVSKKSVSKVMPKMWHVTMNMVLSDDTVEVLNTDHSVRYRTGDSIAAKEAEFIGLMQADIDKYKSEQAIFTHATLDAAVTNVEAGLVV